MYLRSMTGTRNESTTRLPKKKSFVEGVSLLGKASLDSLQSFRQPASVSNHPHLEDSEDSRCGSMRNNSYKIA
jgi:hypothetical protein